MNLGVFRHIRVLILPAVLLVVVFACACSRTKYICPAYQSSFYIEEPIEIQAFMAISTPDSSIAQDSSAMSAADSALILQESIFAKAEDIRITPVLQPKRTAQHTLGMSPSQFLMFTNDSLPNEMLGEVHKDRFLMIIPVKRKAREKLMATVPMITVFPQKADTTEKFPFETNATKPVN